MAMKRLQMELKQQINEPNYYYSIEVDEKNFMKWNILLLGPSDTIFEGGIFKCQIEFPKEYPNKPPSFKFIDKLYHPNIYPDGKVCISILHEGVDEYGYEDSSERWSPVQTIGTIFLSIISLFHAPNCDSPANVDASVMYKKDLKELTKYIRTHSN